MGMTSRVSEKVEPVGVCDHCKGAIHPDQWYTRRGARRYCSVDCRNTANSRAGNPERTRKLRLAVKAGVWKNPAKLHPPTGEEQAARARLGRRREVQAGTWRNPGLTPQARTINSLPHKHAGALAAAIEKLGAGLGMAGLSDDEAAAYRAWRRSLRTARRDEANAYHRRRWRALQDAMTEEEREAQRERWRAAWKRRKRP